MDSTPDVSVVLAAYNEEKYLPILLASLHEQQTSYRVEVIVVDDQSSDRTAEIAACWGARVIPNDARLGVVEMRNLGARLSRGRAILLSDADCAYSVHFVQRMAAPILADGPVEATESLWQAPLGSRYDVVPDGPFSESYRRYVRRAPGLLAGKRCPIRVGPWLATWLRSGLLRSPWSIGDRVRTGMLMVGPCCSTRTKRRDARDPPRLPRSTPGMSRRESTLCSSPHFSPSVFCGASRSDSRPVQPATIP